MQALVLCWHTFLPIRSLLSPSPDCDTYCHSLSPSGMGPSAQGGRDALRRGFHCWADAAWGRGGPIDEKFLVLEEGLGMVQAYRNTLSVRGAFDHWRG